MSEQHFHVSHDPKDLAHVSDHHATKHRHRVFLAFAVGVFVVAGFVVYLV